jgi:hypothetical protein
MGDTDHTHDLIRARLDLWEYDDLTMDRLMRTGPLVDALRAVLGDDLTMDRLMRTGPLVDALRAVLDRLDNGYCSTCDPAYRNIIADALGVTHD